MLKALYRWLFGPRVAPTEWSKVTRRPVYSWTDPDTGVRSFQTDIFAAASKANFAAVAKGDWPHGAVVYEHVGIEERIIYSHCKVCDFCTIKDNKGRCRPCEAARLQCPSDPKRQRVLSRLFSLQHCMDFCGPDRETGNAQRQEPSAHDAATQSTLASGASGPRMSCGDREPPAEALSAGATSSAAEEILEIARQEPSVRPARTRHGGMECS